MRSSMMTTPLLLSRLLDHAAEHHSSTEIVARRNDGTVETETWAGIQKRAKRLANALNAAQLDPSRPIMSLAWSSLDHLELLYAALGMGFPLHILNPRISIDDLVYMIELSGAQAGFFDYPSAGVVAQLVSRVPHIKRWIFLDQNADPDPKLDFSPIRKAEFIESSDHILDWPEFDEHRTATIAFTSGTTGRPKGVAYSHRSLTLTAMNMSMADMYADSRPGEQVTAMPIAAFFHANGWLMPYTAPMNGHRLVLPGRNFGSTDLIDLIASNHVTIAAAVPTVWIDVVNALEMEGLALPSLRTALVAGSRMPPWLYDNLVARGIAVRQSWGMTEAPGATRGSPPPRSDSLVPELQREVAMSRQGRIGFQTELRIVADDACTTLPNDGRAVGHLQARGPSVVSSYIGEGCITPRAWLETGDLARIFPDGTIEIVDRIKDVIKSGGEWISSPQLEQAACSHPAVVEAAAIGVPHERWQERPLLVCKLKPHTLLAFDELRHHMADYVAKWWLPDRVEFVAELPKTSNGKIDKRLLRERYHQSPAQEA